MTLVIVLYIALLLVFGLFTAFILRHNAKYGYLSPHFKIILLIFGLMASALILFSLVLLMQFYKGNAPSSIPSSTPSSNSSNLDF